MKGQVLIINDDKVEMAALNRAISEDYRCVLAMSVNDGVKYLASNEDGFSAVVIKLDIKPMSGLRFIQIAAENNKIASMPFIVTVENDDDVELDECFELGVVDYISKPFVNARIKRCVDRNISVFEKFKAIGDTIDGQNANLQKTIDDLKKEVDSAIDRQAALLEALGTVVEYRNLEDVNHVRRIKKFTEILGKHYMEIFPDAGLTEEDLLIYSRASIMHDIGKICIPDSIMLKPGKLTDEEFEFMRSHTTKGVELLKAIEHCWDSKYTKAAEDICRWHHERFDGRGYPDRLEGDKIPISAQLVSIVDTYDALVSDRVYKKAYTKQEAFKMITGGECGEFSPQLMEAFRQSRQEFEDVVDEIGSNESLSAGEEE
ncbi:MAG: HD domain-containing protein [Lachnospiraceae bacterium]|nr:HD domain-containing protein [Lachnospiraceae bacterium]